MALTPAKFRSVALENDAINPGVGKVRRDLAGFDDASGQFSTAVAFLPGAHAAGSQSIAASTTVTVASAQAAKYRLHGFHAYGPNNALLECRINGTVKYRAVLSTQDRAPWRTLPIPELCDNVLVELRVTNQGTTPETFYGVLFGE